MKIGNVSEGIKDYLFHILDEMANGDFAISALKPVIQMGIENNFYKITDILKLVADKNGEINFTKLVDDTIHSLFNNKQAVYNIGNFATAEFDTTALTIRIPSINKFFKFDSQDFLKMKNYIVTNYK